MRPLQARYRAAALETTERERKRPRGGVAFLMQRAAAAKRAAAERWHLSDRERAVHAALG